MASKESEALAIKWRSVATRLAANPGLDIVSQRAAGRAPEADKAIADIALWLRPKIGL